MLIDTLAFGLLLGLAAISLRLRGLLAEGVACHGARMK
jgi:hypothetical protein